MAIVLKANKVSLFVSSVLFVLRYHSQNFLDTPCTVFILKLEASNMGSQCFTQYPCTKSLISLCIYAVLLCVSGGPLVREDSNGSISQELSGASDTTDGTSRVPKINVGAGNTVLAEMKARQDKRTSSPQQVSLCGISGLHSSVEHFNP
jgi:hypothetical protein